MNLTFRPFTMWLGPETQNRKPGPFFASWTDTMQLLDTEVDLLANGGRLHTDAIIEVKASERAMRQDGNLRADAKVEHPGVVISFQGPQGPLRFACDKFEAAGKMVHGKWTHIPAWQMNLRAIALGLEALRKVDRYGIASSREQYRGFTAIGGGGYPMGQAPFDRKTAAMFFIQHDDSWGGGMIAHSKLEAGDPELVKVVYRRAAKKLHPDNGGDEEKFKRLEEAKAVLLGG